MPLAMRLEMKTQSIVASILGRKLKNPDSYFGKVTKKNKMNATEITTLKIL